MMIKVVRGNPTPEELAAALAVVQARAAAVATTPPGAAGTRDAWADPARVAQARRPAPGPTSWARTYWPV
ncbi:MULTISPECIES: acyl-CoA carboxylase epsilon subunit [unclassified Streptomyces]|uniref:acyl-CoA carboxylase epsilon subunit n=3 Tax=Streptomyces TaxID=1883 RepID=UPI00224E2A8B|nr:MULTISPECIES: acyl-CoA carboxylase epsilon subunit [unclassified Streptomyces]MCX5439265.1 acyl-CoA carboxylase epsilon subunit [Streptomyces sp. NBC_00063]WSE16824.1 acyl-CoA carboxylase subunit epsilon [Streptomyces sp. NBC_01397]WUB94261.1 acyl-CoA carboxylase subunit epsilon [Streptomyces sp. NBC_00569]